MSGRMTAQARTEPTVEVSMPASANATSRRRLAPRLSLNKPEAAECLGVSVDSFARHVQPDLRVIRRGRLRLFPVRELERWIAENAERPLERWERNRTGSEQ